jgi:hypothetical protein
MASIKDKGVGDKGEVARRGDDKIPQSARM